MNEFSGRILTPSGLVRGIIRFGERIEGIERADVDGPLLLPGFVDVHVHGGGGGDTMDGPDGVLKLARFHLGHGTTTLLPTTITNPWEKVLFALDGVDEVRSARFGEPLPDIPGVHLEGPFISPGRLGAQPPFTRVPSAEAVAEITRRKVVKVVTLAPELPEAMEAAAAFVASGVNVSVGHTRADYGCVSRVADVVRSAGGTLGFTHLFNAMGGVEGRSPGPAAAALADREAYAELILDGHHVSEGAYHVARVAKGGRLMLVTDCIRAGGGGDGESELGGQPVRVTGGAARLSDGTLAGSVLTLDRALRNALAAGVSLAEASYCLSGAPSRYLRLPDRGEIALGKRADLVALDDQYEVAQVWVQGEVFH